MFVAVAPAVTFNLRTMIVHTAPAVLSARIPIAAPAAADQCCGNGCENCVLYDLEELPVAPAAPTTPAVAPAAPAPTVVYTCMSPGGKTENPTASGKCKNAQYGYVLTQI